MVPASVHHAKERIEEHVSGFFESHAMLGRVRSGFLFVPDEGGSADLDSDVHGLELCPRVLTLSIRSV
jgi:hypothetical protein